VEAELDEEEDEDLEEDEEELDEEDEEELDEEELDDEVPVEDELDEEELLEEVPFEEELDEEALESVFEEVALEVASLVPSSLGKETSLSSLEGVEVAGLEIKSLMLKEHDERVNPTKAKMINDRFWEVID